LKGVAKSRVWVGSVLAVLLGGGAVAPAYAGDEAAAVIRIGPPPESAASKSARLHAALDKAFGQGKWRVTSGYRSPERENQLRLMGAGTVPVGVLSHHSIGTPSAPDAYDVVVDGMTQSRAAEILRKTDPNFSRVLYEAPHGPEGAHLHIEMGDGIVRHAPSAAPADQAALITAKMDACNSVYERVVGGHRNSKLKDCP
jgi:hypothetical protein